jgi:hypothetical protein
MEFDGFIQTEYSNAIIHVGDTVVDSKGENNEVSSTPEKGIGVSDIITIIGAIIGIAGIIAAFAKRETLRKSLGKVGKALTRNKQTQSGQYTQEQDNQPEGDESVRQ